MPGSGLIEGRIFSIAVGGPTNATPYVAIGPAKPGGTNGGNKFASYDPATGNATWEQNGPDGDAQAIELINGTLYGGFHGGWNGDAAKRIEGLNTPTAPPPASSPTAVACWASAAWHRAAAGSSPSATSTHGHHRPGRGLAIFD